MKRVTTIKKDPPFTGGAPPTRDDDEQLRAAGRRVVASGGMGAEQQQAQEQALALGGGGLGALLHHDQDAILARLADVQRKAEERQHASAATEEGSTPFLSENVDFLRFGNAPDATEKEKTTTTEKSTNRKTGREPQPPARQQGKGRNYKGSGGSGRFAVGGAADDSDAPRRRRPFRAGAKGNKTYRPLTAGDSLDGDGGGGGGGGEDDSTSNSNSSSSGEEELDSELEAILESEASEAEIMEEDEEGRNSEEEASGSGTDSEPLGVAPENASAAAVSAQQFKRQTAVKVTHRQRFRSTVFERYHRYGYAQHTLMSLSSAFTFRGPCLLSCVVADALADGHSLRTRPLLLNHHDCHVAVVPTKSRGKKMDVAQLFSTTGATGSGEQQRLSGSGGGPSSSSEGLLWDELRGMDSAFGKVDWQWVSNKVSAWKQRLGTMPCTLLVLEAPPKDDETPFQQADDQGVVGANPQQDRPHCFAHYIAPCLEESLIPTSIPAITKNREHAVAIVGCPNIGKSTCARFLTNSFLSLYRGCSVLWADFDLGQPEFGYPGSISLHRVNHFLYGLSKHQHVRPLEGNNDYYGSPFLTPNSSAPAGDSKGGTTVECLASFYLGSAKSRCPVAMSRAIAALCDKILEVRVTEKQTVKTCSPLVINTHGWVLSTGRRATLEVLRRLRPEHVVHLLLPRESPEWLTGAHVADVSQGLNAGTVSKRFQVPAPTLAPVEEHAGEATAISMHRATVHRDIRRKKAASNREIQSLQHLGLTARGTDREELSNDSCIEVRVSLSALHLVLCDFHWDKPAQNDLSTLAALLAHAVVSVGKWSSEEPTPTVSQSLFLPSATPALTTGIHSRGKGKGKKGQQKGAGAQPPAAPPQQQQHCGSLSLLQELHNPPFCYGLCLILSSEEEIKHSGGVLRVRLGSRVTQWCKQQPEQEQKEEEEEGSASSLALPDMDTLTFVPDDKRHAITVRRQIEVTAADDDDDGSGEVEGDGAMPPAEFLKFSSS